MSSNVEIEPRLYGLESEHGNFGTYPLAVDKAGEKIHEAFKRQPVLQRGEDYYSNGSRIYIDAGRHLEYATPECLTLQDLVAAQWAGYLLVADRVDALADGNRPQFSVNTRITFTGEITWGSHENYRTPPHINPRERQIAIPLLAHLATRNILVGAGMITEANMFGFEISQKAQNIAKTVSSTSTSEKPLILTREEHHADTELHHRLQIVGGDPTMIPWSTAVRFGSTALVLRMIEAGEDLSDLALQNPLFTNRTVSTDTAMTRKVNLMNGKAVRPLDLQLALAKRSLDFVRKHDVPEEEVVVAHEWLKGLHALRTDRNLLYGKSDWVTKLALIERRLERVEQARKLSVSYAEAYDISTAIDLSWGELSQDGTAVRAFAGGRLEDPLETAGKAKEYTITPPPGRARERGELIGALARHVGFFTHMNWDYISSTGSDKFHPFIAKMPDPFGNNTGIKRGIRRIKAGELKRR